MNEQLVKKVKDLVGSKNTVWDNEFDKDFFESLMYQIKERYKLD